MVIKLQFVHWSHIILYYGLGLTLSQLQCEANYRDLAIKNPHFVKGRKCVCLCCCVWKVIVLFIVIFTTVIVRVDGPPSSPITTLHLVAPVWRRLA